MMPGNLAHEEEIKRYLFRELSKAETERFEEKLFEDNDYFYDVLGLEDALVDKYALGKLSGADLERFEKSLLDSPGRREKVAAAVALQRRIADGKQAAETERAAASAARVARASLWERIEGFFSLQSPALRYAAVGLMLLVTCGFIFLAVERFRIGRELAHLRDQESQRREQDLQKQLAAAAEREAELRRQLESESGKSEVLNEQLEGESAERERLQRELERLRHERRDTTQPTTIASVFLLPSGTRGAGGVGELTVGKKVGRIAVGLELEDGLKADALYNVELNGRAAATDIRPRRLRSGKLRVTVTVPTRNLVEGLNRIVLKNEDNLSVGDYELNVQRR